MPLKKWRDFELNGSISEAVKAFMHSGGKTVKARNAELTSPLSRKPSVSIPKSDGAHAFLA
jgi:hypothetical protein